MRLAATLRGHNRAYVTTCCVQTQNAEHCVSALVSAGLAGVGVRGRVCVVRWTDARQAIVLLFLSASSRSMSVQDPTSSSQALAADRQETEN